MIVPEGESWRYFLFAVRGTTWSRIWKRLGFNVAFAAAVTLAHVYTGLLVDADITALPFTLIGFALSIFLGFRINSAYDRFWEGRKLWGSLVNTSRSLARQILTLVGPEGDAPADAALVARRRRLVLGVVAFCHALRLRLRAEESGLDEFAGLLPAEDVERLGAARNRPNVIVQRLGELLEEARRAGQVHPLNLVLLHQGLAVLSDVQGACERIANTPIPFAYQVMLRRIIGVYCYALPFGVLHTLGLLTPVVVLMMSYAFYGLDAIADEIQSPFGNDPNDLPLSALCRTIEIDLREALGDAELPAPAAPHHGQLL